MVIGEGGDVETTAGVIIAFGWADKRDEQCNESEIFELAKDAAKV